MKKNIEFFLIHQAQFMSNMISHLSRSCHTTCRLERPSKNHTFNET